MIKSFNAVEYLVDKYVEGEYAIIPIKLENQNDFFNKHDPTQVIGREISIIQMLNVELIFEKELISVE